MARRLARRRNGAFMERDRLNWSNPPNRSGDSAIWIFPTAHAVTGFSVITMASLGGAGAIQVLISALSQTMIPSKSRRPAEVSGDMLMRGARKWP